MSFKFELLLCWLFSQYFRGLAPVVSQQEQGCSLEEHGVNVDDDKERLIGWVLSWLDDDLVDLEGELDEGDDADECEEGREEGVGLGAGFEQFKAAQQGR